MEKLRLLELTLHNNLVGYLAGSQGGRNVLLFDDVFQERCQSCNGECNNPSRLSKIRPIAGTQDWVKNHKLHPILSRSFA